MKGISKVFPVGLLALAVSLPGHADEALLQGLQEAEVPLSSQLSAQLQAAQTDAEVAAAIRALVISLGDDGDAIVDAVEAAAAAAPDQADIVVEAAMAEAPALVAAIVQAGIRGAMSTSSNDAVVVSAITATAVSLMPTQEDAIVAAAISAAPALEQAIEQAAGEIIEGVDAEDGEAVAPSPS